MSESVQWEPYVAYVIGAVVGVLWPYARKYLEFGVAFDWRKVAGKVLLALAGLLLMPSLAEVLAQVGAAGWVAALGMGIAATFVGHEAQQTPGAVAMAREGEDE